MPDMFIWSLDKKQVERMTGYDTDILRKIKVNNLVSLSFTVERDELNQHAFDLMEEKCWIQYDGTTYTIEDLDVKPLGDTRFATVECDHVFFDEFMNRTYSYQLMPTGLLSINQRMSFITAGTSYTFSVIGTFPDKEIENFGVGNPLENFKTILEKYEAEFDVVGNDIRLYNRLGVKTGYPFRSRHNITDIVKTGSARNLSTYIKGFGKEYDDQNISTGVQTNFQSRSSGWADTTDPWWYTDEVGRTFTMQWTGTGISFCYLASPDGGVWEFKLDDDQTATLSCWAATASLQKIDLFMDAPEQNHTCIATFKGDDESHVPSTGKGKSRGWVRYSSTDVTKTFVPYRLRKDDEKYAAVAEYTSPLAEKYGIRVQAPEFDDRFTNQVALVQHLKEVLNDKLEISHEMTFIELRKAGYESPVPRIGDTVPYIVEELGIEIPEIRIVEINEYPENYKSSTIVLGTSAEDFGEAVFNSTKNQLSDVYNPDTGKINPDVLPPAVKMATDALNNSLTQLEYPVNGGILARDPNDYNKFVVLRSTGLGITRNGGLTYDEAITALGINTSLLTAGQIKTNNIQIIGQDNYFYWDGNELIAISPDDAKKFVRLNSSGLYAARGSITIERGDGFKLVDNGYSNFNYAIDNAAPPPASNGVYLEGRWYRTINSEKGDVFYYSFEHVARYLYLQLAFHAEDGGGGYVSVEGSGADSGTVYQNFFTTHSITNDYATYGRIFVVDLGTPTGGTRSCYVRIRSTVANKYVAVRHIRGYLRG